MPHGEFLDFGNDIKMESDMPLQVTTVSLGENNTGPFGPDETLSQDKQNEIVDCNANPQNRYPATRRYRCVDGRTNQQDSDEAYIEKADYDPYMAGGLAVTDGAVIMMTAPVTHSEALTTATKNALEDGFDVIVHGANGNKGGCKANEDFRQVLRENAANIHIVVPIASALVEALGMSGHVSNEDLNQAVVVGGDAANNDELWDIDVQGAVDTIIEAGGEYDDLVGDHHEVAIRVDLAEGTVNKARLTKDLSEDDRAIQQFVASLGQYTKDIYDRYMQRGKSETEAAQHIAKAILYTIGISKHLSNEQMPVHLVS